MEQNDFVIFVENWENDSGLMHKVCKICQDIISFWWTLVQMIRLDIILVGLRDYQDQKADVIMKYNSDEARRLKNLGHLPDSVNVSRFRIRLVTNIIV